MKKLVTIFFLLIAAFAFAEKPKRKVICVIDTGIRASPELENKLCGPVADMTGRGIEDKDGHGTNVASIIARQIDGSRFCIVPVKWYHNMATQVPIYLAINKAVRMGANYINISAGGDNPIDKERNALKRALDKGIVITVAAGNDNQDLNEKCSYFPSCYSEFRSYNNWHVVANFRDGSYQDGSNYNGPVNSLANGHKVSAGGSMMSGTSQASAQYMGQLVGAQ